jgi:hypothetical protein
MKEYPLSEQFAPFPPCSSVKQVEVMDWMIFGLPPKLLSFTREVTSVERAAGITMPYAFVLKTAAGITRQYGASIPLN